MAVKPATSASTSQANPVPLARRRRPSLTATRARYTTLGYRAAEVRRKSGNALPEEGSSDYHARDDRDLLVAVAREFDRDNGFYRGIKGRSIDNILGPGFTLQADTGDKELDKRLEKLWEDFGKSPEIRGLFPWERLERAVLGELIDAGDFGAVKTPYGLQMIKAERIAGGEDDYVEMGVRLDPRGRPVSYYVSPFDGWGQVDTSQATLIPAESFIFGANLESWDQTRGMPAQVSNFPMFHRINDIADSEAEAWQILSKFAVMVNSKDPGTGEDKGETDDDATDAALADRIQDLGRAIMFYAEKGEELRGVDRNVPGMQFVPCFTMFIRCLGLPMGLPLELILLDWSKTNYSQARAALEQAYRVFLCWQSLLRTRWHTPVYLWRVRHWVADGLVPDIPEVEKHFWECPQFPWVDQLKEATAWERRIGAGLATHAEALASLNRNRREYLEHREQEIREAVEIADRINKEFPKAYVDWRSFAGITVSRSQGYKAAEADRERREDEEDG